MIAQAVQLWTQHGLELVLIFLASACIPGAVLAVCLTSMHRQGLTCRICPRCQGKGRIVLKHGVEQ